MNLRARKNKFPEKTPKKKISTKASSKSNKKFKKTTEIQKQKQKIQEIPQTSDYSVVPEDVINVLIDRFFMGNNGDGNSNNKDVRLEHEESDNEGCSSRRKRKITVPEAKQNVREMSNKGKRTKVSCNDDVFDHPVSKRSRIAGRRSFSIEKEPESVTVTFGGHEDTVPKRKSSSVEQEQPNLEVFSSKSELKRPRGRPKKVKDTTAGYKVSEVDGHDERFPQPREKADCPVAILTEKEPDVVMQIAGVLTPEHNNQLCAEAWDATPLTCSYTGKKVRTMQSFTEGRSAVRKVVEFNAKGQPIGPVATKFTSFLGIVGRRLVPVTYESWSKVPIELKNKLWNHVEDKYIVDSKRKKRVLSSIGEKWKSFKSNLWKIYILPFKDQPELLKTPPQQYGFIKQDQWQVFVKFRFSEKFQTISKLQAERRAKNLYNHRLGRRGYAGLIEELKKQSLGTSVEDIDRAAMWKKARQDKNGTYKSDVVKEKADRIDEFLKLKNDGNLVIEGSSDVLTQALGTPENSYRVRGVGGSITPSSYFHLSKRRSSKKYISELEQKAKEQEDKLVEMNKTVEELQEQSRTVSPHSPPLATVPSAACNTTNSDNINDSGSQDDSGCANDDHPLYFDFETDCQSSGKGNTNYDASLPEFGCRTGKSKVCMLAVGSKENIVAGGIVFERVKPDEKIHNTLLGQSNVRVSVQYAVSPNSLLPIPVIGEMTMVKDAVGSFVAWPKEFVLTGVQEEKSEVAKVKPGPIQPSAPSREKSSPIQLSAPAEEKSASFAPAEDTLGPIQAFASFIDQSMPTDEIGVPIQNVIYNETVEVHLQKAHLMQFCNMQEITASCIISYTGFLYQNLNSYQESYGFVNPASISSARGPEASSLITKRLQNGKDDQLVFIPYKSKGHWILIVIDSSTLDVYWLDPLQKPPSMDIKIYITTGLKALQSGGERRPNPTWHCVKCPNQALEAECGYTVLRYMRELMEEPSRALAERVMQLSKKSSYSQDEIDEVRLELIDYILTHM